MTMLPTPLTLSSALATLMLSALALGSAAHAADEASAAETEDRALHAQFTSVTQRQRAFRSPYQGDNSLSPGRSQKETADITLYLGLRLWQGAEVWVNPELDHGFGLSNTLGVAGFPSGEAYKVGKNKPYWKLPRLFVRQVVALGEEQESVPAAANTLAGQVAKNNLTFTVGKFSVVDVFDGNSYAHDPRGDFLNWSVVDAGAFDYAADAWGFTQGASAEWQTGDWTLRGGLFALSDVPNSVHIDIGFGQRSTVLELEHRHDWAGRHGELRLLWFRNSGRMGRYDEAVALARQTGDTPDTAAVRRRGSKSGWALNLEQEITPEIGAFARWSVSDGAKEAYEFTEINRSVSGGWLAKGALWGQPTHSWGGAVAVNALSGAAVSYFRAGGLGILIGDGQLPHYGREQIVETFYKVGLGKYWSISADLQRISNPAYNRDRGPVNIIGLRLHAEL